MALKKLIKKENGVELSYHRILSVDIRITDSNNYAHAPIEMNVIYESYLNEEYRNNNKPIESRVCSIPLMSDEEENKISSIREFAYNKMKELPEWSDAIDC